MNETCCRFGAGEQLAGIVTVPDGGAPERALVLVSAGLVPKFGPYRLYVELARRVAQDGVATLRFDLGGIGDSGHGASGAPLQARTELEIRAAVDWLSDRYPVKELVLGGLCSGAEDSFRSAALDARITGVVLIDPFAYGSRGHGVRRAFQRLGRRTLRALGVYAPAARPKSRPRAVSYNYMEKTEALPILRTLVEREARVHFVYTAGVPQAFRHPRQLGAQFDDLELGDLVTLDYFPHLDHTQLLARDRRAVIETIARRLSPATPA
jgi:dienelactone hydrolase